MKCMENAIERHLLAEPQKKLCRQKRVSGETAERTCKQTTNLKTLNEKYSFEIWVRDPLSVARSPIPVMCSALCLAYLRFDMSFILANAPRYFTPRGRMR